MKKNAIATLTTAIKNVEAKNFKLNVQKNQKKNDTAQFASYTYWGDWREGKEYANIDTKGMYSNFRLHLKSMYDAMDEAQYEWHHVAYMKTRLLPADESNASVRFTKNVILRIKLAKMILDGTICNDYALCHSIRKSLANRGFGDSVINRF